MTDGNKDFFTVYMRDPMTEALMNYNSNRPVKFITGPNGMIMGRVAALIPDPPALKPSQQVERLLDDGMPLPWLVCHVWMWMEHLGSGKTDAFHYAIAEKAIKEHENRDPESNAVAMLAQELAKHMAAAREKIGFGDGIIGWHAAGDTLEPLQDFDFWSVVRAVDGMLWLDAEAATYLDGLGGEEARKYAKVIRECATQRWAIVEQEDLHRDTVTTSVFGLFSLWACDSPLAVQFRFATILARVLWVDVVARLDVPVFTIQKVAGAQDYAKMPKHVAGMSWAFGAPGTPLSSVVVEGQNYVREPAVINALVPRTYSLLPKDYHDKPHQTTLPLERVTPDGLADDVLAVSVADSAKGVLTMQAAKLALLILAGAGERPNTLQRMILGEVAKTINPDAKRIENTHCITIAKSAMELRDLWLYMQNDHKVQVFDVPLIPSFPNKATKKHEICARVHPLLAEMLAAIAAGHDKNPFRGWFIINMTGAMKLKSPGMLRQYIRAAAIWNSKFNFGTHQPDPDQVPTIPMDVWAAMTNSYPPNVVEYHQASGEKRRQLANRRVHHSRAKDEVLEELKELEKMELVVLDKANTNKDEVRILQPKAWLEAWRCCHTAGTRSEEL